VITAFASAALAARDESPSGAWEILERFGLALQQADQPREQVRLTLEAVRDALGADTVYWHPGRGGDGFEVAGAPVTAAWAAEFAAHVLAESSADRLVRQFLDRGAKPASPWPCSAALARVSRSRGSWMAALSFHPRRLFETADLKVMLLARRMLLAHRQQGQVYDQLRDSLFGLVRCLTAAIDAKDPYTWGHSERVARIAVRVGRQMGLAPAVLSDLYLAGLLHDIGKIGIRDGVLQKPGALTPDEYEHVKRHPLTGDRLVASLRPLAHLRPGVRHHHERWDGKGYPDGLAGEEIPLQARILAVADACDAMMAARPYRPALDSDRIDATLTEGAGSQWDPIVVAQFMLCREELYAICRRRLADSVFGAVERALQLSADPANEGEGPPSGEVPTP
jgi:HD-GYP domain-containing protein (c-di-GMP phosphodiesterase class II)